MEAPFKGIKDDLAARGPLYIDDFKQGISTKSLVRVPIFHPFAALLETNQRDRAFAELRAIPRASAKNFARHPSNSVEASRYVVPFFERRAARGSRDDDARTTSLVPFFSNVLPRGPCWVIHRGFSLNKTLVERFAPASWQSRLSARHRNCTRDAATGPED